MGFRSYPSFSLLFIFTNSFFLIFCFSFSFSFFPSPINADVQADPILLDRFVRDHAFQCYAKHPKTAFLYPVPIPSNLSGISAHTARYRSGSLRRYGAQIQEFRFSPGTNVRPYVERLILVRETWTHRWSSFYNISGFQLLSPVLAILAYDADNLNSSNPTDLEIFVENRPISIDFSNISRIPSSSGVRPLCAYFDIYGNVSVYDPSLASWSVCDGFRHGHYALLMESLAVPTKRKKSGGDGKANERWWKEVVGSSVVGGVLVAVLLGLLCVALVQMKKKTKIAEMERRAYEEEALQMAMVGHVMVPTAGGTRTLPTVENDYTPS